MSETLLEGTLYLYNGGGQPEIYTVRSVEEVLLYASFFKEARLIQPGQPPLRIKPRTNGQASASSNPALHQTATSPKLTPGLFYDGWRQFKNKPLF